MTHLRDVLDLVARWMHLIAGIMWVGNSMLFNWLDRNLEKDPRTTDEEAKKRHEGRIWMVHSGGFYDVEKKQLAPNELPRVLHWFKWQSYTTWMTGVALLVLVYYTDAGQMIDPNVRAMHPHLANAIGIGTVLGGFFVYDAIWRSPLKRVEPAAMALTLALFAGVVWLLTHTLSGRAAYIHVGALLGTCMSGNVFFHIIPSQKVLVEETREGKPQDKAFAHRAKQRSIHNNYMTFPLLFVMISNHFPSTYGTKIGWLTLAALMVTGALVRHFMNIRFTFRAWLPSLLATVAAGFGALWFLSLPKQTDAKAAETTGAELGDRRVLLARVRLVVAERCQSCHSSQPTDKAFAAPPQGVAFDTLDQLRARADKVKTRVVDTKTMPFANRTGMTDEERDVIAQWVAAGAPTE
jgi:uncharacterized membrane protein